MTKKRVRLICTFNGGTVAEADLTCSAEYIVFANRVFKRSFTQESFEYFREVKAERITHIDILRNTSSPSNMGQREGTKDNGN